MTVNNSLKELDGEDASEKLGGIVSTRRKRVLVCTMRMFMTQKSLWGSKKNFSFSFISVL